MATRQQFASQFFAVLDDAVVHDMDRPAAVRVRMRVALGNSAVGCPAGVTNTNARKVGLRKIGYPLDELGDAVSAAQPKRTAAAGLHRDADGIVASILERLKRVAQVLGR